MNRAAYFGNQNRCCQRDDLQMFAEFWVVVVFIRIAINGAFRNSFPHSPSRDSNGTQALELAEILKVLNGKDHRFCIYV